MTDQHPSPDRAPLLGLLLRIVHQQWHDEVSAALAERGFDDIKPAHANVFPFVPDEGITATDLAERAGVRKQSMAQSLDELEGLGYLIRRPAPNDRRARLVFLLPRGIELRPVGRAAGRRVEKRWASIIGAEALEDLRATLLGLASGDPDGGGSPKQSA